jgi:hypothetical protein
LWILIRHGANTVPSGWPPAESRTRKIAGSLPRNANGTGPLPRFPSPAFNVDNSVHPIIVAFCRNTGGNIARQKEDENITWRSALFVLAQQRPRRGAGPASSNRISMTVGSGALSAPIAGFVLPQWQRYRPIAPRRLLDREGAWTPPSPAHRLVCNLDPDTATHSSFVETWNLFSTMLRIRRL